MSRENNVQLIGNLTEDPVLRFTQDGVAVCTIRIAVNRFRGKAAEDDTTYWNVATWRELADNVSETLGKGDRVVVLGYLTQRSYENKEGVEVHLSEVSADEVTPSLRWAQATVSRVARSEGSSPRPTARAPQTATQSHGEDVPF